MKKCKLKSFRNLSLLALTAVFSTAMTLSAHAFPGEKKYSPEAKISINQARSTAEKVGPGKIVSQELEKEKGGSGLRYSFDVKSKNGVVHEVGIDAKTGKVLEPSIEKGGD